METMLVRPIKALDIEKVRTMNQKGATFVLATVLFTLLLVSAQSVSVVVQAQEESSENEPECGVLIGSSFIEQMIADGTADQSMIDNYNDEVRTEEIMQYIDENIDSLDIPDLFKEQDSKSGLCLTARDVTEQERLQGVTFVGEELDENIVLQSLKVLGELSSRVLDRIS